MIRTLAITAACSLAFFAIGLGSGSHFDSDDALYAEMAREMVRTGDLVDNQWSGAVLFEKPPLYLWTLAASGAVFGWGEAAMRLPGTLFAVGALLALLLLARGLGATATQAATAVGLLAGSYLFVLMTRRLMTDIPLVCCVLGAAAFMVHGRTLWFGAFCGLAVLAKGVAAGPLIIGVVGYGVVSKRLGWPALAKATGVGLLVAAPWHIAVTLRHGAEFWQGYVGYHVGARATSHVVPGLTLAQLADVALLERLLLLLGLAGLSRWRDPLVRFASVWLIFAVLPPIVSTTRLPHYLLPMTPALALLAIRAPLPQWWEHRLAPAIAAAAVLIAFAAQPAKVIFWLDPDFGPDHKALGVELQSAEPEDLVAAWNVTSASLTFYSDGHRVEIIGADPRFYEIQEAVLMVQRAGVLHATLPAITGPQRRFVVTRKLDVPAVASALRRQSPARPLSARVAGALVLVNDAGLGDPLRTPNH